MKRAHILSLILFVALGGSGCKRLFGPRSLEIKPAATARATALAIGVAPSMDRSFERVGALAGQLGLPFDAKAMREQAFAGMKLPANVLAGLDTNAPASVVLLPPGPKPKEPSVVVAATLKSIEAGQQIRQAMGQAVASQLDAQGYKMEDGTSIWLWQKERQLVAAERVEDIVAGAALAMESLRSSNDDLKFSVFPAAIAASQGTDLKTWQAKTIKELQDSMKEMSKLTPGADKMGMAEMTGSLFALMVDRVSDLDEAGLSVALDANRGASVVVSVVPKKGTLLASFTSQGGAYKLDPAVLGAGDPSMVAATSAIPSLPEMWKSLVPLFAKMPKGAELTTLAEPLALALTGAGSVAVYSTKEGMKHAAVFGLTDKTKPAAYVDASLAMWNSPVLAGFYDAAGLGLKLSASREGDVAVVQMKMDSKNLPAEQAAAMKAIYGDKFEMAVAARDHQALMAMGQGAKERLKAMTGGTGAEPTGDLAAAVKETAGAGALLYFDIIQFARQAMGASPAGAAMAESPTFAKLRLPLWLSFRGGERASMELRVPSSSLRSLGAVIPMIMGMGALGQ
jgi:hypothetical protein